MSNAKTATNWTPGLIEKTNEKIAEWEREAVEEELVADALDEHVQYHRDRVWICRSHAHQMRERMKADGVFTEATGG